MRIDQLPIAASVANTDTLPFNHSGTTLQVSVADMTNSIRDNVYGAPLTATSASAMTDTSKVYVYTGNTGGGYTYGHWYYYNGSAWTDGGVYNSAAVQTDTSLTLSGVAADAKATGDRIALNVRYDAAQSLTTAQQQQARTNIAATGSADVEDAIYAAMSNFGWPYVTVGIKSSDGTYPLSTTSFLTEKSVRARFRDFALFGKSTMTGTPSPSNPATIVTTGSSGSITLASLGKNRVVYPYSQSSLTVSGVTFTVQSDGSVKVQGTAADNNATFIIVGATNTRAAFITGQSYKVTTYNGGNSGYGDWDNCWFQVYEKVNDTDYNYYETFTWKGGAQTCNMAIRVKSGSTVDTVVYPMVRVATESSTAYEPYGGTFSTLPLTDTFSGVPVTSGGNVSDFSHGWHADSIENGTYIKRNRVITDVLGTLDSGVYVSGGNTDYSAGYITFAYALAYFGTIPEAAVAVVPSICTHLAYDNGLFGNHTPGTLIIQCSASGYMRMYMCVDSSDYAGLSDDNARIAAFKSWWTDNNVVAVVPYFQSAAYSEPYTVTALTTAQLTALNAFKSPSGNGNVYTTDAGKPLMFAEYYQSIEARLDALANQ